MILLVVVGAINQSKYVPMMSLAVVRTLTNQILWVYAGIYVGLRGSTWVYVGLCRGLHGSMRVYAEVYAGLCGSMWIYTEVYMGLRRGLHGSMWVYMGLCGSTQVYHWLPIATIDLVGDNREFDV